MTASQRGGPVFNGILLTLAATSSAAASFHITALMEDLGLEVVVFSDEEGGLVGRDVV